MNRMKDKILELERTSRLLEPAQDQRQRVRQKIIDYSDQFLNHIETLPVFVVTREQGARLLDSPISEDPIDITKALRLIRENVDFPGLNPASGGHLAYIPGGGIYFSSLGDYLADVTNRFAGVFFASPGAVRMENMLIRWLADIVGYPKGSSGNLTSGGSIANLIAVVTARDAKN